MSLGKLKVMQTWWSSKCATLQMMGLECVHLDWCRMCGQTSPSPIVLLLSLSLTGWGLGTGPLTCFPSCKPATVNGVAVV